MIGYCDDHIVALKDALLLLAGRNAPYSVDRSVTGAGRHPAQTSYRRRRQAISDHLESIRSLLQWRVREGAAGMSSVHPIPADEEWMAMLRQIEEPLLFHLVDEDDEWQLPEVFEGRLARDAWWRIFRAVRDAFAAAERHRLLAADGYYELAPLALVEIARADIEVLNRVADECSRPGPAWAVLSWPSCWRAWSRATRSVAAEPVPRGMTCSQSWIRLPRER